MTNAEIVESARRILYGHDPNEAFSCVEIGQISAALGVARIVLSAQQEAEQQGPCSRCEYGGKHLDAPPCTTCPAHPKGAYENEPLTLNELREMAQKCEGIYI